MGWKRVVTTPLRAAGEIFVFSLVNHLGSHTSLNYVSQFHGRCNLTFYQTIRGSSIGIPVLGCHLYVNFLLHGGEERFERVKKSGAGLWGMVRRKSSSILYTVDGRNPAACGIVEPLSMLFCISTIERVAEFLPSTV